MRTNNPPVIGIHMDGNSIDFAVIHNDTVVMRADAMVTSDFPTPDTAIAEIGKRILELKEIFPSVKAVGMGLTGFADYEEGTVHSLSAVPGWHDIPIRRILTEISGLPATIDNDANCFAYAEWKMGAGRGMDNLVCLSLGLGIGSGIIANGQFLRGHMGVAGEIGQSSVDYQGRIGHYGNRGAIENYIGTATLARDASMAYAAAGIYHPEEECTVELLANYACDACPVATRIWDEAAKMLASCLTNCCYILNPEAIIIGGTLARAGDSLIIPLKRALRSQLFDTYFEALEVLPASFGDEAGIIGAGRLALDTLRSLERE